MRAHDQAGQGSAHSAAPAADTYMSAGPPRVTSEGMAAATARGGQARLADDGVQVVKGSEPAPRKKRLLAEHAQRVQLVPQRPPRNDNARLEKLQPAQPW